ncbi:META domain-containing protein [Pseudomonas sp. GD03842]|uniref:META domain-containing protein n=1 Tax=Pseudomonas sp. GD03842 TaxID=2975385 RepID=UPI00244D00EA|nr:META domain-containing protein [Pseudomonas sp. GD03842]MDH0748281.1 META domain-containing protein [Pseudomonas sp. GD03842]
MKRLLVTLAISLLSGCAHDSDALRRDHGYVLEWIGERPLIDNSHLTMTLGEDGRAYGSGGCNHWFAAYRLEGDAISFGPVGSTRRLCAPALMEQERRFFDALGHVQRWDLSNVQQLQLWPAEGLPLRLWLEED